MSKVRACFISKIISRAAIPLLHERRLCLFSVTLSLLVVVRETASQTFSIKLFLLVSLYLKYLIERMYLSSFKKTILLAFHFVVYEKEIDPSLGTITRHF